MNLDDVKYGNPTKEHDDKVKADRAGILKSAIEAGIIKDVLENHTFPLNSSDETKNELEYLVELTEDADEDDIRFCKLMETNHYDFFFCLCKKFDVKSVKIFSDYLLCYLFVL